MERKSWLFTFNGGNFKINSARNYGKTYYHHSSYGPTWGGGHDLNI